MGMHKIGRGKAGVGGKYWEGLSVSSGVKTFNLLNPREVDDFNKLVNDPEVWVKREDITVHPMERLASIYAVVFFQRHSGKKQSPGAPPPSPSELLDEYHERREQEIEKE